MLHYPVLFRHERLADEGNLCSFGITEVGAGLLAGGLGALGAGGAAIGTAAAPGLLSLGLAGAAEGAALGTGLSAIEGKPLGQGALFGGLTGGAVAGLGPLVGSGISGATGLSAGTSGAIGDVVAGAGAGAAGGALTGQSPLTGAFEGGAAGLAAGVTGTGATSTSGPTMGAAAISPSAGSPSGVSGASAPGAIALPAGGSGATPVDLSSTTPIDAFGSIPGGVGTSAAAGVGLSGDPNAFFTPGTSTPLTTGVAGGDVGANLGAGGTLNNLFGYLSNNPGLLLGAGALGADLMMGNQPLPGQQQVQSAASDQASVGRTLSAYGLSGTLPSGLQDVVNMNTNAGIAAVRGTDARLGLEGSTMEAQQVQQIKEASAAQTAQLAQQLLSQGAQWTGMSDQELNTLLQTQMQQDAALTGAIGTFAGALAGSSLRPQPAAA